MVDQLINPYSTNHQRWFNVVCLLGMPRPLNSSIAIYSLEVRTIFSLFVLKKHMLSFAQIISAFRTGCWYPVSGTCSCSSFCKWRTGACLF